MNQDQANTRLYSLTDASPELGGISVWTLRNTSPKALSASPSWVAEFSSIRRKSFASSAKDCPACVAESEGLRMSTLETLEIFCTAECAEWEALKGCR